jgi:aromatic-amino-acid transaminase
VDVLARYAKKAPIAVLMDIAYSYYAPDGLDVAMESLTRISNDALVLFAWSASKSFLQYGLRVGSLVALMPEPTQRKRIEAALTFSCRGLWSNCNAGGMHAITKVLSEPELLQRVRAERAVFVTMLAKRVHRWNELASAKGLHFPRYDGGFFTTVFCDDAQAAAVQLRERGIYVVPLAGALRVAMCAVNEVQIERIVNAIAEVLGSR